MQKQNYIFPEEENNLIKNEKIHINYSLPITFLKNHNYLEKYFCGCFSSDIYLTDNEIKNFCILRKEANIKFDEKNPDHINYLKELWQLVFSTDFEEVSNPKWKEIGFQNKNPASDFRGAGLISLQNLIFFIENNGKEKVIEMNKNENDFIFGIVSINTTFFLFKYFHLANFLEYPKHKNEISSRRAFKKFCRFLSKNLETFNIIHNVLLLKTYNCWIGYKKKYPKSTIMDFEKCKKIVEKYFKFSFSLKNCKNVSEFKQLFLNESEIPI